MSKLPVGRLCILAALPLRVLKPIGDDCIKLRGVERYQDEYWSLNKQRLYADGGRFIVLASVRFKTNRGLDIGSRVTAEASTVGHHRSGISGDGQSRLGSARVRYHYGSDFSPEIQAYFP